MSGPAAQGKQIAKRLTALEDEHKSGVPIPIAGGGYTQPAVYFERDRRDDRIQTKAKLTELANEKKGLGNQVLVTEEDIKYLSDQKTKEELYLYDKWFYDTFLPGADPNKIALAREMNPAWFQRREENIRKQISLCKKLAKLGLRGPRNQEELDLVYALRQGRIEIPDLDFLFPSVAEQKLKALEINSKKAVVQGYFNPRNFSIFSPAGVTAFSAATPFKVENTNNRVERNGPSRVEAGKVYL